MPEIIIHSPDVTGRETVYAAEFGFSPAADDNTEALCRAIAYCKQTGAGTLCLAPGTYRIKSPDFIALKGFENFVLDGCGAEIISETSYFFLLEDCQQVLVKNLFLDYDWNVFRPASLVRLVDRQDDRLTLEFLNTTAPEQCHINSFNRYDEDRLTPGAEDGLEIWVGEAHFSDFAPGTIPNSLSLRCTAPGVEKMQPGEIYLVRHMKERQGAAFYIYDSCHITLANNTVYSTLGMTHLVGGKSHHLLFDGEVIKIRPDSKRYQSTDGDGIHIIRSKGYIVIRNCDFSGMGDDDVNIHDCHMFILAKTAPDTVVLENEGVGDPGNLFELRRPDFSPSGVMLTLRDMRRRDDGVYELQFTEPLPDEVGEGYLLLCKSYCSDHFMIVNNHFHDHRARGLLLQVSDGLVEDNTFENIQGAGIYVMLETLRRLWYEGAGAEHIIIRNNRFINCNCGTWTSAIDVMAILPNDHSDYRMFRHLRIENNEISTLKAPAVYFSTCEDLAFTDNRITLTGHASGHAPVIVERGDNCIVSGNTLNGRPLTEGEVLESNTCGTRRVLPMYAGLYADA